jgi:hypothetical protein
VLVIGNVSGMTAEEDQEALKALGISDTPAEGSRIRMAGPTDGGWRIVSLWDSQEAFDRFRDERLMPMLKEAGRPAAQFEFWPIESVISR